MPYTKFKVVLMDEATAFLESLPLKVYKKIDYNIGKVAGGIMDKDLFKKLEDTEIWEFRTLYNGIQYRLLAFWDTEAETLVIATHGFVKKTQKTPQKEIDKAEILMKEYFNSKNKDMKLTTIEELRDKRLGTVGTPERDRFEEDLQAEINAYFIGEAIRKARQAQNLTQEQLGERIGVQKSQISKFERGKSITLTSLTRVFKALGIATASLDLGGLGKVALW